MSGIFTYSKREKLKSRKLIKHLFSEGKSFTIFPVKVIYLITNEPLDFYVQAGVGASVKNFKKAVDRNRIKRLLREAFRTEKLILTDYLQQHKKNIAVFFLYVDKTLPEYNIIKNKMFLIAERLIKELNENIIANN